MGDTVGDNEARTLATILSAVLVTLLVAAAAGAAPPATMRVDYYHTGNDKEERFSLDRVVVEPLPWPGNPAQPIDTTNRGKYLFEVVDASTGRVLYSRGFSSIYGEWETTAEAKSVNRTFSESLRFPASTSRSSIVVKKARRAQCVSATSGRFDVDPADKFVVRGAAGGRCRRADQAPRERAIRQTSSTC